MVYVKVRETYDLATVQNKMTVIGVHTPKPDIIKANFPGLLMQCKMYRPVSCDVRIACASTQPLDPLGVGTTEGDIAPEDLFNPILYKACSNYGMSQIEARIFANSNLRMADVDVVGQTADVDVDTLTTQTDEFPIYYGLLSNAHEWRHANPQSGLEMTNLRPLVHEVLYNIGDMESPDYAPLYPTQDGSGSRLQYKHVLGDSKPIPFMNCTTYSGNTDTVFPGFNNGTPNDSTTQYRNASTIVPYINVVCGAIIIPPSRLHQLFYRMVVEWTLEFTSIRPISEITNWVGLGNIGKATHYQNYDYSETKKVLTGTDDTILTSDQCMVSANVDVKKVM